MRKNPAMNYAIPAPAITTVPVVGGGAFPVRRIYCVGRNYAAHAREMGHDPDREDPFFFMKPADAIVANNSEVPYPPMTKDYQGEAKKAGRPWDFGKGFDHAAPCAAISPVGRVGHLEKKAAIWLEVNGKVRQKSDLSMLIWSVPETIAYLSRYMMLAPGDLIYSGTPEGVAAVVRGDKLHGHVDGLEDLNVAIV